MGIRLERSESPVRHECCLQAAQPVTNFIEVSVVVPAYDEEHRIERMLEETVSYCRARRRSFEVLVVDDGSRDRTSGVVNRFAKKAAEVRLIRLAQNHGKGYAVRTGVVNAHGSRILFADADGATPIGELERLEAAVSGGADVAIGSRAVAAPQDVRVQRRWYRHVMGRTFHAMVSTLGVRGIHDTQCGFKLFRGSVAHELFSRMRMTGFSFDVEVLLMAQQRGYQIAEVPVNWVHQPGSKVRLIRDSLRMSRDLLIIRSNSLRGEYLRPRVAPFTELLDELPLAARSSPTSR
jgi:dolichyl-phosphate beta-glucosyltransferase